jgi:hypothetical protein
VLADDHDCHGHQLSHDQCCHTRVQYAPVTIEKHWKRGGAHALLVPHAWMDRG